MKSTLDILSTVFKPVKATFGLLITGDIYLFNAPDGDQNENIILNVLNNPGSYVQEGIMNVNIEAIELERGVPNSERFNDLVKLLIPLFDDTVIMNDAKNITVHCDIDDDKGLFKEQGTGTKYFYNIRVRFVTL